MCAEKTNDKKKKSTNSSCNGMEEMMKNCFSRSEEAAECCSDWKEKCSFDPANRTGCMAMFQRMREETKG